MKLQILVQLAFLPYFVSSKRVVRFIFNSQATCSATDNEKIDAIFETPVLRRLLRTSTIVERQLTSLSECKDNCAYNKNCRVAGCIGFDGTKRQLVEQLTCSQELQNKHEALDKLIATNPNCSRYSSSVVLQRRRLWQYRQSEIMEFDQYTNVDCQKC
jgi:hypothetical protein